MTVKILFIAGLVLFLASRWDWDKSDEPIYEISNEEAVEVNTDHDDGYLEFVVNLNTYKYHLSSCRYAVVKDERHITHFKNEEFLMEHGYSPCKKCIIWR